ncbi:AMP-binding protein [Mycobacterium sp. 236(2023)]|uniref:AMP-binding protein n=1 Tax=Mycobacterium sp. 236(2023) TaxID=3038163 RepID=UPI00241527E7|nr:AMP-binding protein [Mycobacterium sp. 236(2023)]MDG4668083.1 AMP-binding protein [Mycobacterium sp. 236(2023)]
MTLQASGWTSASQDTTLGILRRAVEHAPDTTFLDFVGTQTSYAEFFARTMRMAHGLIEHGVGPNTTVITLLDNNIDAVVAWFAVNAAGGINVPVNTAYKGEFLRHQIVDSGASLVIAEADYAQRVLAVADGLPDVKRLFVRGLDDSASTLGAAGLHVADLVDLYTDDGSDTGYSPDPSDLTNLIYTAGTTGPSKGCMVSHNYAHNLARQCNASSGRRPGETIWTPLPLFHLNATVTSVLTSAMLASTASLYPRFSVSGFWDDIERSGARMVSLLGATIPLIAQMPENDAMQRCRGQIRVAYGAPFPADLVKIWRTRFGVEVAGAPGYGLTEASLMVSGPLSADPVPNASGRRNEDFDVRIVDDSDNEIPAGEVGEIICRPLRPHVMFEGYWRRPESTAATMRNLWFHTGDMGKFDSDGNFYFVDRKKDYLRRRGENISSYEMEYTLLRHDEIAEVAVHAVLSDLTEDDVKVTAVRTAGSTLTEEALCRWCIEHMPYFAVPRYIEFREELPKNPVGRVLKYQLRDEGRTPSTWDRDESDITLAKR